MLWSWLYSVYLVIFFYFGLCFFVIAAMSVFDCIFGVCSLSIFGYIFCIYSVSVFCCIFSVCSLFTRCFLNLLATCRFACVSLSCSSLSSLASVLTSHYMQWAMQILFLGKRRKQDSRELQIPELWHRIGREKAGFVISSLSVQAFRAYNYSIIQ